MLVNQMPNKGILANMKQIEGAKLHWERAKNVIETYKTYENRSTSMVFEAVLVKKLCSDVTVMKIFQKRIKSISIHEKMLVSQGLIIM